MGTRYRGSWAACGGRYSGSLSGRGHRTSAAESARRGRQEGRLKLPRSKSVRLAEWGAVGSLGGRRSLVRRGGGQKSLGGLLPLKMSARVPDPDSVC